MSEVEALLGLYGAVDRAVEAGDVPADDLAPLLGAYRDGAATGWYRNQYVPWVLRVNPRAIVPMRIDELPVLPDDVARPEIQDDPARPEFPGGPIRHIPGLEIKRPGIKLPDIKYWPLPRPDGPDPAPAPPPVDEEETPEDRRNAIRDALLAFPEGPVEGRVAARRFLAVSVATRAMPHYFGVNGEFGDAARSALSVRRPDDQSGDLAGLTQQLHARITEQFISIDEWPNMVRSAISAGVLPMSFEGQEEVPPCTGKLIMRPDPGGSDKDPCTVLESGFTTSKVTFAEAKNFLVPTNWHYQGSFWTQMEKDKSLGPNTWLYHETVATSDPADQALWSVSTDLQVWLSHPTSYEARLEYDLPDGWPKEDSQITIDEGSLQVFDLGDKVQVRTTKRVRFTGSFDGAGLAMFMCATGYSSVLEDIVFSVASGQYKTPEPFPITAPQGGPMPDETDKTNNAKTNQSGTQKPGTPDSLEAIAKDAAKQVETYLTDASKAYSTSLHSINQGTYKVENAWSDAIKMWSLNMAGLTKAFELGSRTAKVVAQKPAGEK